MNKYLAGFIGSLKMTIAFRAELILWSIIDIMPLLGMLVLWYSVIPANGQISGYTQQLILQYYLIGFFFRQLTGAHFEDFVIEQIRKGTFSFYLLKPITVQLMLATNELAWRFMSIFTSVLPVFISLKFFLPHLIPQLDFLQFTAAGLLLVLGYILECIYSLFVSSMGFIFENAKSFMHLRWIITTLFSGILIPYEMMPSSLQNLANFLPFRFRFYLPTHLVLDQMPPLMVLTQLIYGICWIIFLTILVRFVWDFSLRQYSAAGQ